MLRQADRPLQGHAMSAIKSFARLVRQSLILCALATPLSTTHALGEEVMTPIPTQYIAALGDSGATAGTDAATWGLWAVDPGPRGVRIKSYEALIANGGVAPSGWQFDQDSWWLEEHGLIMESPTFPLPPGKYVVTGGREVTTVLTVSAPDASAVQSWSLADGATILDVTHLRCRAALYTPASQGQSCTPDKTPTSSFPMSPGVAMPNVENCTKRDYHVLIVIGMMKES